MTIDLFALRLNDTHALGNLIDLLLVHCDSDQVERFLADFEHWHRLQGRRASPGERDAARVELEQWQEFINSLPEVSS